MISSVVGSAPLLTRVVVVLTAILALIVAIVVGQQQIQRFDVDFSKGEVDPVTGKICILQQVCLSNPEELAKRLPQEPCFPVRK